MVASDRRARRSNLKSMADVAPIESIVPRLAAVREQLSLLSDYL